MIDLGYADHARDRKLRRQLLRTLHGARVAPLGGLHGRPLVKVVGGVMDPGSRFASDDHAIGLLKDLANKGLITLTDERTHPKRQPFGLDYLLACVTAKGSSLLAETIERDPDIEDERDPEGV